MNDTFEKQEIAEFLHQRYGEIKTAARLDRGRTPITDIEIEIGTQSKEIRRLNKQITTIACEIITQNQKKTCFQIPCSLKGNTHG